MTWPDRIATAIGILTALLLTTPHRQHNHRSTTEQHQPPQDGDQQ